MELYSHHGTKIPVRNPAHQLILGVNFRCTKLLTFTWKVSIEIVQAWRAWYFVSCAKH